MNPTAQKHQPNKTQELKLRGKYANGRVAIIDASDSEIVNKYEKWWCTKTGYVYAQVGRKNVYLARLIMNPPDGLQVDHIDRKTLDNRRCNLRVCTSSQNTANRGKQSNNTSGFVGVNWMKKNKKWRAEAWVKRKNIHIGMFDSKIEAARARDIFVKQVFGDFANLNGI